MPIHLLTFATVPARLLNWPLSMDEPDSDEDREFAEWFAQTRGEADDNKTKSGESAGKKSDKKPGNGSK